MKSRIRSLGALTVALITGAAFLHTVGATYPCARWLFWTMLKIWGWQILQVAAWLAVGNLILDRLLSQTAALPWGTRVPLAAAVGALTFALGMFGAGCLGWLRPAWAVIWPVTLLLVGVLGNWDSWRLLATRPMHGSAARSSLATIAIALGTLGLGIIYLGLLAPDAVSFDAAWTHLAIAQDYAREGRIVRFDADWPKNLAHLGSVINTWAFLLPGLNPPPVRWMMALHTEFVCLLFTLAGVGAGVQWAIKRPVRGSWAMLLLFPGLFVYDGNLGGASDHFAAFFVTATFVAVTHAAARVERRWWALVGALAGGAISTKYQSFYALVPMAGWLAVTWITRVHATMSPWGRTCGDDSDASFHVFGSLGRRRLDWNTLAGAPVLGLATALAMVAPHFLRNWTFYGNPLFPFAQRMFTGSHPTLPDSALMAENIIWHFGTKPPVEWGPRMTQALRLMVNFSFVNPIPVFGSLFTITMPLLLFVVPARRVYIAVAVTVGALFLWAWTYRVERNLQTFVPLMAIATAAVLAHAWQQGILTRIGVAVLVLLQLIWSGDHFFSGSDRLASAMSLIRSGYEKRAATRFDSYGHDEVTVGRALPANAKVLLHNLHVNLGIDRPLLHDGLGFQSLLDPRRFRSVRDLYDALRGVGVTHVVFHPGYYPAPSKQEEVVFAMFADRQRGGTQAFGNLRVFPLADAPPPQEASYQVLALGIGGYADGVYDVAQLCAVEIMPGHLQHHGAARLPATVEGAPAHFASVDAVLLGASASSLRDHPGLTAPFHLATEYPAFSVWVR